MCVPLRDSHFHTCAGALGVTGTIYDSALTSAITPLCIHNDQYELLSYTALYLALYVWVAYTRARDTQHVAGRYYSRMAGRAIICI